MSSVIRRKIEAGAGLPRVITQYQEFWTALEPNVAAWASEALGIEAGTAMLTRRVVPGHVAAGWLTELRCFSFSSKASPGLAALAFDDTVARLAMARRLRVDLSAVADASILLLNLMLEAPAVVLWRMLAEFLPEHRTQATKPPLAEMPAAAGSFDRDSRYLVISFAAACGADRGQLHALFELGYLQREAERYRAEIGSHRRQVSTEARNTLRAGVHGSTIVLEGVIDKVVLSLGACSRLAVGQVLPLPNADMRRIQVCVATEKGRLEIGAAETGSWKGLRALKLTAPINDAGSTEL